MIEKKTSNKQTKKESDKLNRRDEMRWRELERLISAGAYKVSDK